MKKILIVALSAITILSFAAPSQLPLQLRNEYEKPISYRTNLTIAKKENNKDYKTITYGNQVPLGPLNTITSLEIKGVGAYSSLNKYLQQLKDSQNIPENNTPTKYPLIVITPKQSSMSAFWNIQQQWTDFEPHNSTDDWQVYKYSIKAEPINGSSGFRKIIIENHTQQTISLKLTTSNGPIRPIAINSNSFTEIYNSSTNPTQYTEGLVTFFNNKETINLTKAVEECHKQLNNFGRDACVGTILIMENDDF